MFYIRKRAEITGFSAFFSCICAEKVVFFFIAICSLLLIGCKSGNDSEAKQQIIFRITNFQQSTDPMCSHRKAPQAAILDDQYGTALTNLYIFDCGTQLAHQTNDQSDFGTITLTLTHGEHDLSFILTRSTDISVDGSTILRGRVH